MKSSERSSELCALCALGAGPDDDEEASVVYLDGEVMALIASGTPGVTLAPRFHVGALSQKPAAAGRFLAALRRTVNEVQNAYGTSGATIEPTTDLVGSQGHVCYRVFPTFGVDPADAGLPAVGAENLALALSRR